MPGSSFIADMTLRSFSVAGHLIGTDHRCFVIAEAGVNHNGDVEIGHQLIDIAADCGADAVKFQTFVPSELVSSAAAAAPYQRDRGAVTQREMLAGLVLSKSAWKELAHHAACRGLLFTSTAFDEASLQLLLELGVQLLKIPSGELDNLRFIKTVASQGLPLIISTGLGTMEEVEAAFAVAAVAPSVALLHCVTAYPAPIESSNLLAIPTIASRFDVPVGWSDHTQGYVTAVAAVALGASILEKHITTDRALAGPDHLASADPIDFKAYVMAVRAAEAALGDGIKKPTPPELQNRQFARRSFHALRTLHAGEIIREDDVRLLRPATGLPPGSDVIGRTVRCNVIAGTPILAEHLR
jgi:N-acetylneuraminate synthase/N,N'-diacetyllegionaminate synthase